MWNYMCRIFPTLIDRSLLNALLAAVQLKKLSWDRPGSCLHTGACAVVPREEGSIPHRSALGTPALGRG